MKTDNVQVILGKRCLPKGYNRFAISLYSLCTWLSRGSSCKSIQPQVALDSAIK